MVSTGGSQPPAGPPWRSVRRHTCEWPTGSWQTADGQSAPDRAATTYHVWPWAGPALTGPGCPPELDPGV